MTLNEYAKEQKIMKDIITVQEVRGYIDENGTAWLNAADVARGLGFVEVKKNRVATNGDNYEAIRWARINGYLREFGFSQEVAKDDFIPENMFYRLAMKASNETAEKFQAKVANEILPAIRKTGSYSVEQKSHATPLADSIRDIRATTEEILCFVAANRSIASLQAIDLASIKYNFDFSSLKKLLPPADHETGYLNPTQISEKLGGLPAKVVNKMLADAGLQYKDGKSWRLTEAGKAYGEEMPYTRNGHSGYQIRWNESVVDYLSGKAA